MGQIVSTIAKDVDDVASGIVKLVTDVGTAVEQVSSIAQSFSGAPVKAMVAAGDIELAESDNDQKLAEQIKNAMSSAKKAVEKNIQITISG